MYCNCGCGKVTKIAQRNFNNRGIKKGEHFPFLHGHNRRLANYKEETSKICKLYKNGHSIMEVSEITGITAGIVAYRVKQKGVSRDRIEAVVLAHHKGKIPHPGNRKPRSKETKRKIAESLKGLKHLNRKNPGACGDKHWNWKGGRTSEIKKIRQTDEYKEWRIKVYQRDFYTCTVCGNKPKKIIAHHIKSFTDYPELRFEIDNGITLCRSCHKKAHPEIGKETRFC